MNHLSKTILLALLSGISMSACVSSGRPIDEAKVAAFKTGATTEADVVDAMGKPNGISSYGGGRYLTYMHLKARPRAATFIPVIGLLAGGGNSQSDIVIFHFGEDGKLVDVSTQQTANSLNIGPEPRDKAPTPSK